MRARHMVRNIPLAALLWIAAVVPGLAQGVGAIGGTITDDSNAILPGVFRTALNEGLLDGTPRGKELLERTPMARFGQVDDIIGAAVFLASESARFVTGQLLAVDGGFLASGVNQ